MDIERYTGTSSGSRESSRKTSPARDKVRDHRTTTSTSLTSTRKSSSTLEPRSASLYGRKSYSDTEGSRNTSPSRYLVKDPFSIKSDSESSRYQSKYDSKFDKKYEKYDTKYDSKYDKFDSKFDRYDTTSIGDRRNQLNNSTTGYTSRSSAATENGSSSRNNPLLKYEIRSYKDPSKSLRSSDYLKTTTHTEITTPSNKMNNTTSLERSPRSERYSPSYTRKILSTSSSAPIKNYDIKPSINNDDTLTSTTAGSGCALCAQNQKKLESEMESTKILFRQKGKLEEQASELKTKLEELEKQQKENQEKRELLEKQLEQQQQLQLEQSQNDSNNNNNHVLNEEDLEELENLRHDNDEMQKEIDKLNKQIRKNEKNLEKENLEVRKLTMKLEDANFEKERLRTELIKSQFENEKVIEENEDLQVDNEDLIKERDEILQIYDEVYR